MGGGGGGNINLISVKDTQCMTYFRSTVSVVGCLTFESLSPDSSAGYSPVTGPSKTDVLVMCGCINKRKEMERREA